MKKSFFDENNLNFIKGIYHEDVVFSYMTFCLAKIVSQSRKALYMRRYRKGSIMVSRKNEKHFKGLLCVYHTVKDFSFDNGFVNMPIGRKYVVKCAFNALNIYKRLDVSDRKKFKKEYKELRTDILSNDAFDDTALKLRCYGQVYWFLYKVFEKTVGRVFKK